MEHSEGNGRNAEATQCVRVAVNIRPLITTELLQGCTDCITVAPGEPQVRSCFEFFFIYWICCLVAVNCSIFMMLGLNFSLCWNLGN